MLKCSSEPVSEHPTFSRWNSNFSEAICLRPKLLCFDSIDYSKLTTYSPKPIPDRGRPAKGATQVRMASAIVQISLPPASFFGKRRCTISTNDMSIGAIWWLSYAVTKDTGVSGFISKAF
jgi:hypothetical protein